MPTSEELKRQRELAPVIRIVTRQMTMNRMAEARFRQLDKEVREHEETLNQPQEDIDFDEPFRDLDPDEEEKRILKWDSALRAQELVAKDIDALNLKTYFRKEK